MKTVFNIFDDSDIKNFLKLVLFIFIIPLILASLYPHNEPIHKDIKDKAIKCLGSGMAKNMTYGEIAVMLELRGCFK